MGEDCAEGQSVVFSDCITVFFFFILSVTFVLNLSPK